jgi:hypothetical protein
VAEQGPLCGRGRGNRLVVARRRSACVVRKMWLIFWTLGSWNEPSHCVAKETTANLYCVSLLSRGACRVSQTSACEWRPVCYKVYLVSISDICFWNCVLHVLTKKMVKSWNKIYCTPVAFNVCNSTLDITKHLKIWHLFLATQTWCTFNITDTRLAFNCK